MNEQEKPIGTAEQLEMALDASIEANKKLILELETMRTAIRDTVEAWHGRGNLDLAISRLEMLLKPL